MKENEKYRKEIEKLKNRYGRPARKVLSEKHKERLKEGLWKLSIFTLIIGLIFMGIKGHDWAFIAALMIGAIPFIILKIDEWWLNPEYYEGMSAEEIHELAIFLNVLADDVLENYVNNPTANPQDC